ncbi:MAG: ribose 5-phosphate isomerase B [Clostridia bacterium]|nr:ribose 5-phosphate isomerase B [Clostridia bacterium]
MAIAIGSDHGGFELKNEIKKHLEDLGLAVQDFGTYTKDSVDYPDIAEAVCVPVAAGAFEFGVLVCGTGIGISIAANKVNGIRAAHCTDAYSAAKAKEHNNANVICLGGRITGVDLALTIVDAYLNAEFEGGRHQNRVDKIMALEK